MFFQRKLTLAFAGALTLGAALTLGVQAQSNQPVKLLMWEWLPSAKYVAAFEATHPNIKIELVKAGEGDALYTKLRTAFKAGTGAPDISYIEYNMLPSFILTKNLVDLTQYGFGSQRAKFVPWTWSQVSQGGKVYGAPLDMAPLAFYYRKDLFDQYKIRAPRTWDEYAVAARAIRKADPKMSIGTNPVAFPPIYNGLLWQAGWRPFKVDGTNISIKIKDDNALKVGKFWEALSSEKVLSNIGDFSPDWGAGFANSTLVGQIGAAWFPLFLTTFAPNQAGKWSIVQLPQWKKGDRATANLGGQTLVVTDQSKHPKEAAEFVKWASTDPTALEAFRASIPGGLSAARSMLNNKAYLEEKNPFFGGQRTNEFFAGVSRTVDTEFQWSPFQGFVYDEMGNQFSQALGGKQSFDQALENMQKNVVDFAKNQGFTLK